MNTRSQQQPLWEFTQLATPAISSYGIPHLQPVHENRHEQVVAREYLNELDKREFQGNIIGKNFDFGHGSRTARYAACIGLTLGLAPYQIELLSNSALLHDLGKQQLPDHILNKAGSLSRTERHLINTHTVIGASILERVNTELGHAARIVALTHHEKWDGSGYPNNIKGKEIPLFSRITSIADIFDALTSPRSYKQPWSAAETVAFIEEGRGRHLDPYLVDIFHQALSNIMFLYTQHHPQMHNSTTLPAQ